VGGEDAWLDSYVTDFLTRARERGFTVPDSGFKLALDRLRNFVSNAPEPAKDGGRNLSYALYVLARNGIAPVGDLRYIADTKLGDVATPIAKAQIAGALGLLGDRVRAERVYAAALEALAPPPRFEFGREDYGSSLRDAAAVVMLAAEGGAPQPTITTVQRVEVARGATFYTSTQENAWMVLAARAIGKQARLSLDVGGERRQSRSIATTVPPTSRQALSRSPTPATRRCARWSRSTALPSRRSRQRRKASSSSGFISPSTASRRIPPRHGRTSVLRSSQNHRTDSPIWPHCRCGLPAGGVRDR
jgi:uncharacterized protein YfaS (alpha-2-macroglobulin family)